MRGGGAETHREKETTHSTRPGSARGCSRSTDGGHGNHNHDRSSLALGRLGVEEMGGESEKMTNSIGWMAQNNPFALLLFSSSSTYLLHHHSSGRSSGCTHTPRRHAHSTSAGSGST